MLIYWHFYLFQKFKSIFKKRILFWVFKCAGMISFMLQKNGKQKLEQCIRENKDCI